MSNINLTRKYLFNKINKRIGFSKNMSAQLVDDFFEILSLEIIKSYKVKITSFGTFNVIHKKQRLGRNPKTKVDAIINARKVVTFKPSLKLKKKNKS